MNEGFNESKGNMASHRSRVPDSVLKLGYGLYHMEFYTFSCPHGFLQFPPTFQKKHDRRIGCINGHV